MNAYLIVGIVVWLYAISILKRARLSAFYFIVGSGGLFFILMGFSDPYWIWFFTHAVIHGIDWLSRIIGWSEVMFKYGMVHIANSTTPVYMTIDFECSGIIETMAYVSLVLFLPIFTRHERVFFTLFGIAWIYASNIIRIGVVIVIVHFFGGNYYFLAHSIIGRLVFYLLAIVLYFQVFTYSQLSQGLYLGFSRNVDRFKRWLMSKFRRGDAA